MSAWGVRAIWASWNGSVRVGVAPPLTVEWGHRLGLELPQGEAL